MSINPANDYNFNKKSYTRNSIRSNSLYDPTLMQKYLDIQDMSNNNEGRRLKIASTTYNDTCSDLKFTTSNDGSTEYLDVGAMLYTCSNTIPSALLPPSYLPFYNTSNGYQATNIAIQLVVNSLLNIDDMHSQASLDFFLRVIWQDPRLKLPDETWDYVNPEASIEGNSN